MKKKTWHLALGLTTIAAFWGLSFSAQASDYSAPLDLVGDSSRNFS